MLLKLATRLRQYGLLETSFLGLRWASFIEESHSLEFFIRNLESAARSAAEPRATRNVICSEITGNELQQARLADGLPSLDWAQEQFARGSRLFAAWQGNETVAWAWFNTKSADLGFIRKPAIALPKRYAYSHGVIVAPAYQGRGIGGPLKAFGCARLASEGVRHVVAAVFLSNRRAIHWHGRVLGEDYWGRITHVRVNRKDHWIKFLTPTGRRHPHIFDTAGDQHQ